MTATQWQALQDTLTLRGVSWMLYDEQLVAVHPFNYTRDEFEFRSARLNDDFADALQRLTKESLS